MNRKPIELINKSDYKFTDISSEEYREYSFENKNVRIEKPDWLAVSESGHRILTNDGISHYIPKGWLNISWKANPHFVK